MEFDVFLCHNSQDKPEVREMARQLKKLGIEPWLDEWELIPGQSWQELLEEQIEQIKSAAVFVGGSGLGPWQEREMRAFLSEFVNRGCRVIPVLLINAPQKPKLPIFLRTLMWVDFRQAESKPMERLICGIKGVKPGDLDSIQFFDESPSKDSEKEREAAATNQAIEQENKQKQREVQSTSVDLGNGIILEMVTIPEGSFLMGTKDEEIERLCKEYNTDWFRHEQPQHKVTIQSFSMGKYPVTQEQWRAIANRTDLKISQDLDPNPARFTDKPDSDRRPVERVSWKDAIEFCGRLSKLTEQHYRLPSEAEWEYACRAKTNTAYSFGENINEQIANYGENVGETTSVGEYRANQYGLYDMHGNVWEWCEDDWHENYENAPTDGRTWLTENSSHKVLRGGSWIVNPWNCRSASRGDNRAGTRNINFGFRVVCSASRTL